MFVYVDILIPSLYFVCLSACLIYLCIYFFIRQMFVCSRYLLYITLVYFVHWYVHMYAVVYCNTLWVLVM